jgi:hypothetical protein
LSSQEVNAKDGNDLRALRRPACEYDLAMGDAETGDTEAKTSKARSDEFVEERPLPPAGPLAKI